MSRVLLCFIVAAFAALSLCKPSEAQSEGYTCLASYYGVGDYTAGNLTASGEVFEPWGFTAASTTYPFGTYLYVYYPTTGYGVTVRVNDYGPAPYLGRCIDLSAGAAYAIGLEYVGVDYVEITEIE